MIQNIHFVTYANNYPFINTQIILNDSINNFSKYNIIKHRYNIESLKHSEYFNDLANLLNSKKSGYRDGFYNAFKAIIINDVYNKMGDNDILYYVDSSQHFKTPFTENIDKLIEYCYSELNFIAGSFGKDCSNNRDNACDDKYVWNTIAPNLKYENIIHKPHILNSWFVIKKTKTNELFLREWLYYTFYKNTPDNNALVTYHHTVDQSIFNILVYKYNLLSFYYEPIKHNENKDRNLVLNIINNTNNLSSLFQNPANFYNIDPKDY